MTARTRKRRTAARLRNNVGGEPETTARTNL